MELLKKLKVSRGFALRGALGGIGVAMWLPGNGPQCGYSGQLGQNQQDGARKSWLDSKLRCSA
jgi:hypothetical protein